MDLDPRCGQPGHKSGFLFSLRPLIQSDVQSCSQIADLAFQNDRQTQLKACSPSNPYNHANAMQDALNDWLRRPPEKVELTVAMHDPTGEILGWVAWGSRGFGAETDQQISQSETEAKLSIRPDPGLATRDQLEAFTSADLSSRMRHIMPAGTKCMFIMSICVNPAYHGHGVGGELLRQGTQQADDKGVFCWVQSSADGANFFMNRGFAEFGRLEVNLDEWNCESIPPPSGDKKWGSYVYRYLKREAVH